MFLLWEAGIDCVRLQQCVGFMVEPTIATLFGLSHFVNVLGEKKVQQRGRKNTVLMKNIKTALEFSPNLLAPFGGGVWVCVCLYCM